PPPSSLLFRHSSFSYTAPPTPHPYPLSLHDALPIFPQSPNPTTAPAWSRLVNIRNAPGATTKLKNTSLPSHRLNPRNSSVRRKRSEEHTSELQSRFDLVCRLLLEKKKKKKNQKRKKA